MHFCKERLLGVGITHRRLCVASRGVLPNDQRPGLRGEGGSESFHWAEVTVTAAAGNGAGWVFPGSQFGYWP